MLSLVQSIVWVELMTSPSLNARETRLLCLEHILSCLLSSVERTHHKSTSSSFIVVIDYKGYH